MSGEEQDGDRQASLAGFELVPGEDAAPPHERGAWKRRGIYLSEVSLAVQVAPTMSHWSAEERDDAKEGLYAYLQRVHQIALEHSLICPVACVVSLDRLPDDMRRDIQGWSGDQDWHRGSFALYTECDETKSRERLADLLEPTAPVLAEDPKEKPRGAQWHIGQLESALENVPADAMAHARQLVDICTGLFNLDVDEVKGRDELDKRLPPGRPEEGVLAEWKDRIVAEARELAEPSEQP
jgi:hypothetical protein